MKYVKDDDRGQKSLEKLLQKITKSPHVAVGILQDEQISNNFSMVDLARVHEFGSNDRGIPARSFIRSTCDAKKAKYSDLLGKLQTKILAGQLNIKQALMRLGEVVSKDMVQTINKGIEPHLAKSTLAAKMRSLKKKKKKALGVGFKPLIDTGRLKGSITHEVRGVS